jgi:carbon-monoxide dehydrogenase medium subunit
MVLAEATMEIVGPRGRRTVPAAEFFRGPYTTALDDEEILSGIVIGAAAMTRRYGFHEIARCRGAFAMTGAIASIGTDPASIQLALFGVAPSPVLVDLGSSGLMDVWGTSDFDRAALEHFTTTLTPNDDFQATALQRLSYAVVCTKEAVHELID